MNSRQNRRFRSYGLTKSKNDKTYGEIVFEKPINVHCSYMDYKKTDLRQRDLITKAKSMYIRGKHAGSKPLDRVKRQINFISQRAAAYTKALEQLKAAEKSTENVD